MNDKLCKSCGKVIQGRADKQFCNTTCKNNFHYSQMIKAPKTIYKRVDEVLKKNRKLLKMYNPAGKSIINKKVLISQGFDPNYYTNTWKSSKGNIYKFCYEYGFLEIIEHSRVKYVLITWQQYMCLH